MMCLIVLNTNVLLLEWTWTWSLSCQTYNVFSRNSMNQMLAIFYSSWQKNKYLDGQDIAYSEWQNRKYYEFSKSGRIRQHNLLLSWPSQDVIHIRWCDNDLLSMHLMMSHFKAEAKCHFHNFNLPGINLSH